MFKSLFSKKLWFSLILLLTLSGCGLRFVYNNLDWWINWYLDDFVSLTAKQQQLFDTRFMSIHDWHRDTQLPVYIDDLKTVQYQLNNGADDTAIRNQLELMKHHWYRLMLQIKPEISELILSLTTRQKQQIAAVLQQKQQELTEEYLSMSTAEWQKKIQKQHHKQFKRWFGSLSALQYQTIERYVQRYQPTYVYRMSYRQQWISEFVGSLQSTELATDFDKIFDDLVMSSEQFKSEELKQRQAHNQQIFTALLLELLDSLTAKQYKKLNNEINGLIEELQDLNS